MRIDTNSILYALIRVFMSKYRLIYAGKTRYDKRKPISYELEASVKRDIRAGVNRIDGDYTMQAVNGMLYELLGTPGVSAGKSNLAPQTVFGSSGGSSAYTSAQLDMSPSSSASSGLSVGSGVAGVVTALLGMAHADIAAEKQDQRQRALYEDYYSPPAMVEQYKDAGLNPMGLAGGNVGTTTTTGAQSQTPDLGGVTSILGALLNYKARMKDIEVREKGIDALVAERTERTRNLEKINQWFDTNQMVNLGKIEAETSKAIAQASTEEQKSALLYQQAIAEYIRNKYADAYEQSVLKLREAEVAYKASATAENYARVTEINQHVQNMVLEGALTVARTESMQQVTRNLGIKEDMLKFDAAHQKGNLIWQRIGQSVSAAQGLTGSVANVFSCFTPIPKPAFSSGRAENLYNPSRHIGSYEYGEPGLYD